MKKLINALLLAALLVSVNITCFAKENSSEVINYDAVVIREDVSHEEALGDSTYDANHDNSDIMLLSTQNVYWKVWGSYENAYVPGAQGAIPLGYSAHMNGETVLHTFHYTRTYLGALFKSGDSGRKWGYDTVEARGTFCDDDVWYSSTHYVKYGTEEDD